MRKVDRMADTNRDKKLFIIDGSSFLYRAYYGLRPLHTESGEPVQAVYGFCRMIKKIIDTFHPEHVVLVWDSKGKTTRHEIFSEYKATRQAPPSDLFDQKEHIIEFAKDIGLFQLAQVGVEADDIIASLARWWSSEQGSVVIVSSDKDMGQLLNDNVVMFDSFKDVIITAQGYQEKMGFSLSKTIFYFSLLGDTSDNIPGVKGIGDKTALELLTQFSSLQDLYNNLEAVKKPRIKKLLEEQKENAFLSEQLFTLHNPIIECTHENVVFHESSWQKARSLFEKLGFKSLVRELKPAHAENVQISLFAQLPAVEGVDYKTPEERGYRFITVVSEDQLNTIIETIYKKKIFAYDAECYGSHVVSMHLVGVSISYQEGESFYIPVAHKTEAKTLSYDYVIQKLRPVFDDETITKIAHNAKFDEIVLAHAGIVVKGPVFDTILAINLVKHEWQKASLKELSRFYLKEPMLTFKQVVEDKKYKDFSYVPLDEATEYAAADAHQTFKLYPLFKKMLSDNKQDDLYYNLEIPVMRILSDMEREGIYCDVSELQELNITVQQQLENLKEKIITMVGPEFANINLNSPKQIEALLFEHLKLPVQKKSAKRTGYSTDYEVLKELAKLHPVADCIARYRELYKLQSTYIEALPLSIDSETGRIHTNYSQTRVATGRLSSSDPNLQNIPAEGLGRDIKKAFKASAGTLFLSVDYSQIELRVLAYLSQDKNLLKAFQEGHDIHAETAAGIFKTSISEVSKEQRNYGKRINFSIIYGLTSYGLSKDLGVTLAQAKEYRESFFAHYPQLKIWMEGVIENTKKNGYTETLYGRRRLMPSIYEHNKVLYEAAVRIAVNTPVQGTAAEIMKKGMIAVDEYIKKEKIPARLILQIHDELIIAIPEQKSDILSSKIQSILENVVEWNVPLQVKKLVGSTWFEVS